MAGGAWLKQTRSPGRGTRSQGRQSGNRGDNSKQNGVISELKIVISKELLKLKIIEIYENLQKKYPAFNARGLRRLV